MKKAKDEMRRSYKRSDFAKLERGKFYAEVAKGTSVALLEPSVAKAFPTSRAVNEALSGLLALTEKTSRITPRATRMNALATSDIDVRLLHALRDEIHPDLELSLDERAIMLKSADPPSWIQFFADAPWWAQALGAYAALYVAELVKEAGKETWKQRRNVLKVAASSGDKLLKLARGLAKLRGSIPQRSKLVLGLPVPDDYFGVRFELIGRDEDILANEIALFVRYVPQVQALIEAEGLRNGKVTGPIFLAVGDDLSLKVTWMDRASLLLVERILRLNDEA